MDTAGRRFKTQIEPMRRKFERLPHIYTYVFEYLYIYIYVCMYLCLLYCVEGVSGKQHRSPFAHECKRKPISQSWKCFHCRHETENGGFLPRQLCCWRHFKADYNERRVNSKNNVAHKINKARRRIMRKELKPLVLRFGFVYAHFQPQVKWQ